MRRHRLRARYGRAVSGAFVAPYTIEVENRVLGKRTHWKASPYASLEEARESARGHAQRSRKFAVYNILDAKGRVVESHQGVA